jgi:hypothetical protein
MLAIGTLVGVEIPEEGCMPHPDTHPAHFE